LITSLGYAKHEKKTTNIMKIAIKHWTNNCRLHGITRFWYSWLALVHHLFII